MGTKKNPIPRYGKDEAHAGQLKSQVTADQKRDSETDSIRLRVPAGIREKIQSYVVTVPQYQRKVKDRVEPNVNQWIVDLIMSNLPDEKKDDII